jgi:hypothetical protein
MTMRVFRCEACGAENEISGETCETCGTAAPEAVGTKFELRLAFAVEECPSCGKTGFGGTCASCGGEIPAPELNPATKARTKALRPLVDTARALVASFEHFPEAHITVTPSQLAATINDAHVPGRVLELLAFARSVGDLDLEDPAAIGGETRRELSATLDEIEGIRDLARLLSEFEADEQVPEQVAKLPGLVARLGRAGAVVIEKVLTMLVAETVVAASAAAKDLQSALDPSTDNDEIERLLHLLGDTTVSEDMNARVALVTGRDGTYTDALGLPDPVLIFAAPPGENTSFASLARGARRYLSHLLDNTDEGSDAQAMLVLPAVQLALLDRPFEHHRRAELVRNLLREAEAKNPAALDSALSTYEDHAGLAFATSMRVRRQVRLLATGEVSPVDYVESSVEMYRQLAESHFRAAMRCVLAARAALNGTKPPAESILLGGIENLLSAWDDELGLSLDGVIERHVRNAEAHQDYYVDPATLEIVLRDGSRLTPDDLSSLAEDLAGAVAAVDAAVSCHMIDTDRTVSPRWLTAGESPHLVEVVAHTVAAGLGITIENFSINDGTVVIELPVDSAVGQEKARTLLWSARALASSASLFEAHKDGRLMAAFPAEAIDRCSGAPEDARPLLIIEALYESAVRCGASEVDSLRDAIATCLRFTVNEPVSMPPKPDEIGLFARRLQVIERLAARHRAASYRELREPLGLVNRARRSLSKATTSQQIVQQLDRAMSVLGAWADQYMGALLSDEH